MKKDELKRRIEDGFSELAPDIFEAVMEATEKEQQAVRLNVCAEEERKEPFFGSGYRNLRRYTVSACAGVLLLFLCVIGLMGNSEENIYLLMDINPSIQIVTDESCQVKSLRGLNQDGETVVKNLEKQNNASIYEILEMLLQEAAAEAYLHENSGILVTISTADRSMYEELENKLGERVDRTLDRLGISGVTTAFRQEEGRFEEAGRKLLEEGLAKQYGVQAEKLNEMSVRELIQYCEEHPAMGLKISETLEKEQKEHTHEEKEEQRVTETAASPTEPETVQKIEKAEPESQMQKAEDTESKKESVLEETQPEVNTFPQGDGIKSENKSPSPNGGNAGGSVQKDTESESEAAASQTEKAEKNKNKKPAKGKSKKKEQNNAGEDKEQKSSSKKDKNGKAKDKGNINKNSNGNKGKDKGSSEAGGDKGKDSNEDKNNSGSSSSQSKGENNKGKTNDNVGKDTNKGNSQSSKSKEKDKK